MLVFSHISWEDNLHITYSCNTRILNFGQQLSMRKWLVYLTDDGGSISSQNDETLANSISWIKAPSMGGKEGTKREDPSLIQKNRTQSGSQKGTGTNHVPEPPFSKGWVRKERKTLDLTLPNFLRPVLKLLKTLGYPQYLHDTYIMGVNILIKCCWSSEIFGLELSEPFFFKNLIVAA